MATLFGHLGLSDQCCDNQTEEHIVLPRLARPYGTAETFRWVSGLQSQEECAGFGRFFFSVFSRCAMPLAREKK